MGKYLDGFYLKILGIILMFGAHVYQMWSMEGAPIWLNMLGRIVAPIFFFLLAESMFYTHNRFAYLKRLLIGSWGMNLITYFLPKWLPNENIELMNNIFATLFLSGLCICAYDALKKGIKEKQTNQLIKGILLLFGIISYGIVAVLLAVNSSIEIIGICLNLIFPSFIAVEGGPLFVSLGVLFYIFREHRCLQVGSLGLVALLATQFNFQQLFTSNIQWMMIFAVIPILLYSGKEGRKMKLFFYYFYPIHLVALYLLATLF